MFSPVCPTVSGQRALRSHSWLTQPSGSLAVRCVKIRYADCHAVSSLSELGNLYRVHGVLLRIFGSTSLYININITRLKFNPNSPNIVFKYIRFNLPSDLVPLVGLHRLIPIGKTSLFKKNPIFLNV